tara:strand:- start:268 stop:450 length:183 start_codon:yes stop_codon:yes gene_type:complete
VKENIKIKADEGIEVEIDFFKFFHHLNKYHHSGVTLDEENGHYFTVNDNFRKMLKSIIQE